MINLNLEKLYRYPRNMEPMWVAVPVKRGRLGDASQVCVYDGDERLTSPLTFYIKDYHSAKIMLIYQSLCLVIII